MADKIPRPPKYPHREAFERYLEDVRREHDEGRELVDQQTKVGAVERLLLKAVFVFARGQGGFKESPAGQCTRLLFAKLTNETLSFIGCVRAGSLYGAWHHLRSLVEIRGALHYIFADAAHTERRLTQFLAFDKMLTWQVRKRLENQALTPAEFAARNMVSDATMAEVAQSLPTWKQVYGKQELGKPFKPADEDKLLRRKQWHDGQLRDLIEALGADVYKNYELLCLSTHVSPVGHKLALLGEPQAFGFNHTPVVAGLVMVLKNVFNCIELIDKSGGVAFRNDGVGLSLMDHVAEEIVPLLPVSALEPASQPPSADTPE